MRDFDERGIVGILWLANTAAIWWLTDDVGLAIGAGFAFGVTLVLTYSLGRLRGRER